MVKEIQTRRKISKRQLAIGLAILALFIFAAWYFTSGGFHGWVRQRIIATIEDATGGRTSIGRVEWNLSKLELVLNDVTIHGSEPAGEAPFVHVDRLYLRAHIVSVLARTMRLEFVEADHPVLHLITNPDGTTNEPQPKNKARAGSPVQALFDLQVDRAEVHEGKLLINNDAVPFDGAAEGVGTKINYVAAAHAFDGSVDITKLDLTYHNMRPFSASLRADFSFSNREMAFRSFAITSGRSILNGTGKLTDFSDPHLSFSYGGKLDAAQAAAITRTPGVRAGVAQVDGTATYHNGQYHAVGIAQINSLAYRASGTDISDVSARTNFRADNSGLQLTDVHGTALGGSFEGEAGIQVVLTRRGREHQREIEERGTAELRFQNIDVQRLQRAAPRKQRELQIQMRGTASGSIKARWEGSPENAVADVAVNIAPPAAVAPGEVPLRANVTTTYNAQSGGLAFDQLQLTMPNSRVEARGSLGTRGAALHVTVATSNFRELQSALSDLGVDFTIPAEIHGTVNFTGDVSGTREEPQVSGHVTATDFDYLAEFSAESLLRATSRTPAPAPAQRIHWDRIVADLQYSSRGVSLRNATLQNGSGRTTLNGSATLSDGHIVPTSRIDLQATVQNEDAQRVATLVGVPYSANGLVSGSVRLSGAASNPTGSGNVRMTNVPLGQDHGTISSAFTIRDHEVQFTNLDVARGTAHVTGTASANLVSNAFSLNVHGGVIDLATLPELQSSRVTVGGKLTFEAQGSGTTAAPEINATVHIADLTVNGESLGDLNAQAVTRQGMMQVSASTTAQSAQLTVDGSVRMQDDYPANLSVKFPHLDFDPLLRAFLRGRLTGHSLAVGTAQVSGPLKNPRFLNVNASLDQFSVAVEKLNLRNVAPVRFRIANEVLTLDQFHIAGSNTDLTGNGTVALTASRAMDLRADGTVDLVLIQTINPNFTSGGKVTLNVRAQGTLARPALTGRVQVENAKLAYVDLPNGLSEVNGTMVFDQNRLVIEKLTGQSGGGALALGGYVAYANGFAFSITGHAQDTRLRYPPGVSAVANAELRWSGTPNASTLSGDVTLTRFGISPQFDFANYLARASRPLPAGSVPSALSNIRLDLHVVSTPALQVSTSLAKIAGDIDVRIRGTLDNPTMLGRVNIVRGTIFFNGTNYQVQRGDITFVNPTTIEPVLNLEFTTRIAGYDINLSLDGPLDRLHTTYRSDPPLPSSDIISLLAFRQCPTSAEFSCSPSAVEQAETYSPTANPSFTETASNQILGEALNATLSNRVQRLFGISRVKISPEIATAIGNPSARITIEQQVSNNVTITYVTDVAQASQQVIQVEYNVNRSISIVAVRDQFGVASFDVRIRRRKR